MACSKPIQKNDIVPHLFFDTVAINEIRIYYT